jgi:hypothetical protein
MEFTQVLGCREPSKDMESGEEKITKFMQESGTVTKQMVTVDMTIVMGVGMKASSKIF